MLAVNKNVQKIMFLRDVVIPFVKEREKEGKVNLDIVNHPCGSPSCLLGWALTFKETGLSIPITTVPLGMTLIEANELFGPAILGTLDDRAKACDKIIERMLSESHATA